MTRPAFMTQPGVWIRAPRTAQTRVDYACAVEHNVPRRTSSWHPAERWFAPLLIVAIVLLAAGWL